MEVVNEKTLLMAIFSKLAKRYAKQIKIADKWIDGAQAQFANAIEESGIAEEKFDKVLKEIETEIAELQAQYNEIRVKKEDAQRFKEKIKSLLD